MTDHPLYDEPQFKRLPKWAQQEIRGLRTGLRVANEKIKALSEGDPESNTWVENFARMPGMTTPDLPLGKDPQIRFEFPNPNPNHLKFASAVQAGFVVRGEQRAIEMQGAGHSLVVHPYSTNLIRVTLGD